MIAIEGDIALPRLASIPDQTAVTPKSLLDIYTEKRLNLVRLFATRLRSMSEAEDLIQDLFFKIQRLENLPVGENPSALLFQMANHLMLDRLRSQKRARARDADWLQGQATLCDGQVISEDPTAETALAARGQLDDLIRRSGELPAKTAEAFRLHKLDGLSHAQTAAIMGISRSTVEKHISAALKYLMGTRQ